LYEVLEKCISENNLNRIKLIIEKNPNYKNLNYNKKLLIEAIKQSSNNSLIKYFINNEENLNYEILLGKTPLFEALVKHNYTITDILLKRGADINYVNTKGYNALFYVKESSNNSLNSELLNYLIFHNINYNLKNRQQKTFLDCLIEEGNVKLIKIFLNCINFSNDIIIQFILSAKSKVKISDKILNYIIERENEKIKINKSTIDSIIESNNSTLLDIILNYKINTINDDIISYILLSVCKSKKIEFLNILIRKGVDVNCKEKDTHITPLMALAITDKKLKIKGMNKIIFEMFKLLLDAGADINSKDVEGKSALMYILSTKKATVKLIELLIRYGAYINSLCKSGKSPLIYACKGNNRYVLNFLLKSHADINVISKDGKPLLCHATMNGCMFLSQYLIENNLTKDINFVDKDYETPLMYAVKSKNVNLVQFLLENGANVNYINNKDESALSKTMSTRISKKMIAILEMLINYGADINKIYNITENNKLSCSKITPLIYAVGHKNLNLIELFIKNGANVNDKDTKGATPLYYAITHSQKIEIVEYLIDNGADVNEIINDENETVIFSAIKYEQYDIIKLLVDRGANVNHKNKQNKIPLGTVMYRKNCSQLFEYLISDEIDFQELDRHGKSLFHYSITSGNTDVFNYIMDNVENIDINLLDKQQNTPLMLAVYFKNIDFVLKILERKPNIEYRNARLENALYIAVEKNSYKIAKLLLENGAKVDNSNIEINRKMLFNAVTSYRIIQLLIKNGFEINNYIINTPNKYGNYPLSIATRHRKLSSIRFLLANNANPYMNNSNHNLPLQEITVGYYNNRFENFKKVIECYEDYGVDINELNENGEDLLFCVISRSYNTSYLEEIIKFLIEEKGADVNIKNNNGVSFLMYLVSKNNISLELVKYLVEERHCDIDDKDFEGNNILMYALRKGNKKIYNYFLDKCQDFSYKNDLGTNLLMSAVLNADLDTFDILIDKGVPLNDVDDEGRNAFFYMFYGIDFIKHINYYESCFGNMFRKRKLFKYLVELGIELNQQDNKGRNILFYIKDLETMEFAVEHGIDIHHKDNEGRTALFYATDHKIIKYLVEQGVDASIRDHHGHTVIYNIDLSSNNFVSFIYLINHGADPNDFQFNCKYYQYFYYVYRFNNISQLVDVGINFDSINMMDNETDEEVKETFLDYFINNYYRYSVDEFASVLQKAMVKKLFDINRKNFNGETPLLFLMREISKSSLREEQLYNDLILFMVEHGASLDVYGVEGKTPLYYALSFSSSLVKIFYEKGSRILSHTDDKKMMLNINNVIIHEKCSDTIKYEIIQFLEVVEKVNVGSKIDGEYPIFLAIEHNCFNLVRYFISKNALLDLTNNQNENVLDVAKRIGNVKIISFIAEQKK